MSNKKSACDTANATSTRNNKPDSIISSATEKIKLCNKKNLKDLKSKAILEPVKKMLCEFSEQNEEFARAVSAAENLESLTIVQCHGYKNERESNNKKPPEIVEFEQQYTKFLEDIKNVRNNSKRTA